MTQARRALLTLLLLLLAAAGLAAVAVRSHRAEQAKKSADERDAQLFDFDPQQVTGLTVEAKGEQCVLVRDASGFRLTQPLEAAADSDAVNGVLQRVRALRKKGVVEAPAKDLAKYGLDRPTSRLTLTLPGGTQGLALGAVNDFSGTQYAQVTGRDEIIQVEGSHDAMLARSSFDLRDKRLAHVDPRSVQRLVIDANPQHLVLERRSDAWQLVEPQELRADPAAVEQLVAVFQNVRAQSFVSESGAEPARYGLEHPSARITATLEGGQTAALDFGEASPNGAPQLFARANPGRAIALVQPGADAPLHVSLDVLEDKTLAQADPAQVAAIQLGEGSKAIVLRRARGADGGPATSDWIELAPLGGKVRADKIGPLLELVTRLTAKERIPGSASDLKPFGLAPPEQTLQALDAAGRPLAEVHLGSEHAGAVYAQRAGDARIFAVEKARLAALPTDPAALLEPGDGGR